MDSRLGALVKRLKNPFSVKSYLPTAATSLKAGRLTLLSQLLQDRH